MRTTTRNETTRLGYGGTVTLIGAPDGSITIEGWSRSEVEVRAEIQLRGDSEQDLDRLALYNGFVLDDDVNHVSVLSTGTHDRALMKKAKNFPKKLLGLPWKIDYRIRVPMAVDLDINAGRGPISVKGVDGNIRISSPLSETTLRVCRRHAVNDHRCRKSDSESTRQELARGWGGRQSCGRRHRARTSGRI